VKPRAGGGTFLIANPASGSCKLRQRWKKEIFPALERILGVFQVAFTAGPGDAELLARHALEDGAHLIIAMGGDGTLNEVVNGYFHHGRPVNSKAEIGILPFGSGGDFIRSTSIPRDYLKAAQFLVSTKATAVDVGVIRFTQVKNKSRYFINIANAGLVASIMYRVNKLPRKVPALGRYVAGSMQGFFDYSNIDARISLHDEVSGKKIEKTIALTNVTIANGRCFGRGMKPAPQAQIDDGLFDIFALRDFKTVDFLTLFPQLYLEKKRLAPALYNTYQTRKITIEPVRKNQSLIIEADGENLGSGAVECEVLGRAVRVKV
jgi:diacylglycerol kinase (ATP)